MNAVDHLLEGQQKPTVKQVAWVFAHLFQHLCEPGSFRYLIYDRMGFGHEAYFPLYMAGGMALTNELGDDERSYDRCLDCGALVESHFDDHLCRMHLNGNICEVCGKERGDR